VRVCPRRLQKIVVGLIYRPISKREADHLRTSLACDVRPTLDTVRASVGVKDSSPLHVVANRQ
jgi:hypothetical protein